MAVMSCQKHTHTKVRANEQSYKHRPRQCSATTKAVSWILISGAPPRAGVQAQAMPNFSSLRGHGGFAWLSRSIQQLLDFTSGFSPSPSAPRQGRNRKASGPNGIIPQATSWTAKSYCRFMLVFSPRCLLQGAASFSLPLPSFPQPLLIHSALWKQMEKGVKMTGVCPPCTGCVPPLVVSPTPRVAHSQVDCTFLSSLLPMKL